MKIEIAYMRTINWEREREREREMIFSIIESQIPKERKIVATAKSKKILLLAPPRKTHD